MQDFFQVDAELGVSVFGDRSALNSGSAKVSAADFLMTSRNSFDVFGGTVMKRSMMRDILRLGEEIALSP
jgi:hypothetical protein